MNQLLTSSASALAGTVRSGEVSSEEIVGAHIKRIEDLAPALATRIEEAFGGWKPSAIFE